MRRIRGIRESLLGVAALALAAAACADEGLWTFEHVPRDLIAARRGVTLDDAWLSRTQLASVRLSGRCSATFVSPRGLMITSRQCVESCLGENTTASANLARDGFSSRSPIEEKRCRQIRGQVLVGSEDITGQIALATAGLEASAAAGARERELARLEQACEQVVDPKARPVDCEPAALHDGGEYRLYKYLDFDDLRLSFAPERAVAGLSGEIFEFPRVAFDVAFLRAYAEGRPVDSPAFVRVNFAGPAEREPLFVSGHPAETARNGTVAQLVVERDTVLKNELLDATELRGRYTQFAASGAAAREHIAVALLNLERELAWRDAMFTALLNEPQLAAKLATETTLRMRIAADADLKLSAGSAFDEVATAGDAARRLGERRFVVASVGERSELCAQARLIVRAGLERQKPDAERAPQFRTLALPLVERSLGGGAPFLHDVEMLNLTFSLERLRDRLGASDPLVTKILGSESPAALAERVISRTRMIDPAFRSQLWNGGSGAVVASDDPLIGIIRDLEAAAAAIDANWRPSVAAPMRRAGERLARARLKFADSTFYPDATAALRLSSGTMLGWTANGQAVVPLTTLAQAYAATNAAGPRVPARWLEAQDRITGTAGLNIAADIDIGGGCTGCAILSAAGDLVGVVIGGNREAAAGRYWYDPKARAVGLDAAALKELLLKVYRTEDLMKEMVIAR